MIYYKTEEEIELISTACKIASDCLEELHKNLRPGITTSELDKIAEEYIRSNNAIPSFKGYRNYPANICVSINDEVVHGLPSESKVLREGDLVSIDLAANFKGYHGDIAKTFIVAAEKSEIEDIELIDTTLSIFREVRTLLHVGGRLSNLCKRIQSFAKSRGYNVIRDYVGHGIGKNLHEDPQVPNYWEDKFQDLIFKPGLVIAIEPMITYGSGKTYVSDDGWTVVTADHEKVVHFEHTLAITNNGCKFLTK